MKLYYVRETAHRCHRSSAAFTLAEVLISLWILGIGTLALMSGFTSGYFNLQLARENQRATQILLEKAETIRLYSWDQVNQSGFIPGSFTDTYDPLAPSGQQGIVYQGKLLITNAPISTTYSDQLKMLIIQLNWQSGTLQRSRVYHTYISEYGLQNYMY
jgi:Tfp pilus assembly protein PilV